MNKGNEMNVWTVQGGCDYEGFSADSLQLFNCKSAAEAYAEDLKKNWYYDYVEVKIMEVQQHSAIAA